MLCFECEAIKCKTRERLMGKMYLTFIIIIIIYRKMFVFMIFSHSNGATKQKIDHCLSNETNK